MLMTTVHTTILPGVAVDVQPLFHDDCTPHQRYVLVLRNAPTGMLELVFPSARDLRAFLQDTRDALAAAREEVYARRAKFRSRSNAVRFTQATLF